MQNMTNIENNQRPHQNVHYKDELDLVSTVPNHFKVDLIIFISQISFQRHYKISRKNVKQCLIPFGWDEGSLVQRSCMDLFVVLYMSGIHMRTELHLAVHCLSIISFSKMQKVLYLVVY